MKILILTYFYRNFGGGEGRVAYDIADNLAKNTKNEVYILAPGNSFGIHKEGPLNFITYKSVGEGDFTAQSMSIMGLRKIYKILDEVKPDIIHGHSLVPPIPNLIQIWAIQNKKPFIYTTHILPSKAVHFPGVDLLNMMSPVLKMPLKEYIKVFYDNCSAVIALNDTAELDVRNFGFKGLIGKIPNGRDLAKYNGLKITDSGHQKVLLYVGNINKRKNQLFLVKAMKYLPSDYELRIIGPVLENGYFEEILEYIKDNKLENVKYLGKLPYEEIAKNLEETKVFVSAATMEVQSLVIIEAMASGTPVVGLSNETVDELVDSAVGVNLTKNTSPMKFATAVQAISNLEASQYIKMAKEGRERVKNLDWDLIIKQTESFYTSCIVNYNLAEDQSEGRINRLLNVFFDEKFKNEFKKFMAKYSLVAKVKKDKKILVRNVPKSLLVLSVVLTLASAIMYATYSGLLLTKRFLKNR